MHQHHVLKIHEMKVSRYNSNVLFTKCSPDNRFLRQYWGMVTPWLTCAHFVEIELFHFSSCTYLEMIYLQLIRSTFLENLYFLVSAFFSQVFRVLLLSASRFQIFLNFNFYNFFQKCHCFCLCPYDRKVWCMRRLMVILENNIGFYLLTVTVLLISGQFHSFCLWYSSFFARI